MPDNHDVTCVTCGKEFNTMKQICFNLLTFWELGQGADDGWFCSLPCLRHDLVEIERVIARA